MGHPGVGGEGEELDVAAGGLLEAIEEGDRWGLEEVGGVDAALGVGEERAFEVDADGLGFLRWCGGFDLVGDAGESLLGGCDGGGYGGGEIVTRAPGGEETAYGAEAGGGGLHDVVAGGAVNVDVEEGWGEDGG